MPAIAGIVYEEALNKKASVENMLAILSHRGSGKPTIWSKDKISLGTYPTVAKLHFTHPHIVLFDGTLFNIPELQSLVKAPTESVEELISCLYDTYKEKFPLLLNGPFAVAIYHTKSQELLLFRDRLGQKPLYWGVNNNTLVFASELKAMLASGEIPQKPDLEALSFYFSFGFIPQEKSPIAEVNKLLPGHYLRFTREKKLTIRPYWSYNSYLKNKTDQKQEELDALISDAVQLRVNDQKPFACFLSSTKEQSNLFFFLNRTQRTPPFSIFYPAENQNLRTNTQSATAIPIGVTPKDLFNDLFNLVWALDEPLADLNVPFFWQLSKEIKKHEISSCFITTGSLPWLQMHVQEPRLPFSQHFSRFSSWAKKQLFAPLLFPFSHKTTYQLLHSVHAHPWHTAFLKQYALFDAKTFEKLQSEHLHFIDPELYLHRFPAIERLGASISSLLYLNFKTQLPSEYLLIEDRFSTAHGFTTKNPFLDYRVVEANASSHLMDQSLARTNEIHHPPLFSLTWTHSDYLRELFNQLPHGTLATQGIISSKWLTHQLSKPPKNPAQFQQLWSVLILEIWFQQFIEKKVFS